MLYGTGNETSNGYTEALKSNSLGVHNFKYENGIETNLRNAKKNAQVHFAGGC